MYVCVCLCARLLFRSLLCDVCLCVFVSSLAPLLVSSFACLLACLLACVSAVVCVCAC